MKIHAPLLALSSLLVLASSAHAVDVYVDNFNSGYTAGNIVNQNGYAVFGATGSSFQYSATGGRASTGGVTINTDPQTATGYAYKAVNYAPTAANPVLTFSLDVASLGLLNTTGTTTSLFGLGVYDPAGTTFAAIRFQFSGGTTTAAAASFFNQSTATTTSVAATGGFNTFKTLGITMNTVANTVVYSVDGVTIGTASYTLDDSVIGDADLIAIPSGYDTGSFDNLAFRANPVPEPGTFAALGLGAIALLRRRKRA